MSLPSATDISTTALPRCAYDVAGRARQLSSMLASISRSSDFSGAKVFGLPLLTILWFHWLPVERVPFAIAVLQSGMPVAATNFIFAQQYGVAVEVTAAVTLVSTVLSLLTLSVLLFLLL